MARSSRFWLVTAAALVGAALTCSLGFWQWGRAQQKLAREGAIAAQAQLPPLDAAALPGPRAQPGGHASQGSGAAQAANAPAAAASHAAGLDAPLLHRRVILRGQWVADRTVFLDNRQMAGRQGFYVVTPLRLADGRVLLVQRGWAPRDFNDRSRLPPVETPAGEVEVAGRLAPPPAQLYAFDREERGILRQNLDLPRFRAESGLPLADFSVQQEGPASGGLVRDWPQVAGTAGKNQGYAFQWWAMSALIAILYVWFQFIAPRRRARPS
jgi:surfeit locus 1 family protein